MSHIIVPGQHKADGNPFANLLNDPRQYKKAMNDFAQILADSFVVDMQRGDQKAITSEREQKHRTNIMGRWFREMRSSGYGYIQTMDEIPKALRAELDGGTYTPPPLNRVWAP